MLYKFQEEALICSAPLNKVAYYYDMGLGKTFIGAEKMVRLDEEINLIVCQKSKVDDWVNHCKLYTGFKVYNLTKTSFLEIFHPNSLTCDQIFSYFPDTGVPDRRITLSGSKFRIVLERFVLSF